MNKIETHYSQTKKFGTNLGSICYKLPVTNTNSVEQPRETDVSSRCLFFQAIIIPIGYSQHTVVFSNQSIA